MTSINPHINSLLDAYNVALGLDLPMTATRERWFFEAHRAGMTPDDISICLKDRLRVKQRGGMAKGIELRHVCGDDIRIDELLCEAAVLRARMRVRVMDPAKATVLRATGRSDAVPTPDAIKADETEVMKALRKAAR